MRADGLALGIVEPAFGADQDRCRAVGVDEGVGCGVAAFLVGEEQRAIRWPVALQAFSEAKILPDYLGQYWCDCFHAARSYECENHHYNIHALDYEWYLRTA